MRVSVSAPLNFTDGETVGVKAWRASAHRDTVLMSRHTMGQVSEEAAAALTASLKRTERLVGPHPA